MLSEPTQARMRTFLILCLFLQLASALPQQKLAAQSIAQAKAKRTVLPPANQKLAASAIQLPLFFEANQGQTDASVRYVARGNGYTMFLTPTETVLVEEKTKKGTDDKFSSGFELLHANAKTSTDVLRMQLIGANPTPEFSGLEEMPGKVNYLIGKNPAQWRTSVPLYSQVRISTVYPGVDLLFHGDQQQLEYDFVVSPGADASKVAFRFRGAKKIEIASDGDLILHTGSSDFRMRKPVIYQSDGLGRRLVDGRFVLSAKNDVSFKLGTYDRSQELVIDPAINYATFLGGAGTDLAEALQVDTSTPGAPKVYVTGETSDITSFPEGGTHIGNPGASTNIFIAKVDPTKTGSASLVYLSFIGGSTPFQNSGVTICTSAGAWLALDTSQGASSVEPVIGGVTSCADYPGSVLNPVTATSDASATVVTRVASNGGSVDQSILLGGNGEMSVGYVFVDSLGDVLLTGPTQSTNLPTIAGAYATAFNNGGTGTATGAYDCFTAKLQRSNLTPTYFSYLNVGAGSTAGSGSTPGTGNGCGAVIDSVNENILYIGGNTQSSVAFSGAGSGVLGFQPTFQGTQDSFVMKLDTSLSGAAELKFATYFGGGGVTGVQTGAADLGAGIVSNSSGVVALAGFTTSNSTSNAPDVPILNPFPGQGTNAAANSENQETGFFTIMDTTKTGSASLLCGSYFGGSSGSDRIRSLAFDPLIPFGYYVIVGGHTESTDFPTVNAFQGTFEGAAGAQDGFVAGLMVNPGGTPISQISFSSYIGAGASEEIDGVGLDTNHTIYATGITVSGNYYGNTNAATTVNGFQTTCTSCNPAAAVLPDAVIFALTSAPTATLNTINVFPSSVTLPISGTQQFLAVGTFSDGTFQDLTKSVTWNSSNATAATINTSGLATAGTTAGMTTITALSGEVTSTGALVTVGGASSVTINVTLVNNGSSGVGTVTDSTGQINCTNTGGELQSGTCSASYAVGTNVTFTETPGSGSVFTGWQDDCSGTTTTCTITVSSAGDVLANFGNGPGTFMLNITPGTGETGGGQVSSQVGAAGTVNCILNGSSATNACSATVKNGSVFVLTELANGTSNFTGWSGACSGTGSCVVTMTQNQTVSPTFTAQQDGFSVTVNGSGKITSSPTGISCANPGPPSVCTATFNAGTQVTLTAAPATGFSFNTWSAGPCVGTSTNPCVFTISTSTTNATATFAANSYLLTVMRAGNAGGQVQGSGISCGPGAGITDCSVNTTFNAPVVLTETPPTGSTGSFSATPSSCVVGSGGTTCSFNMPAAPETVTVIFSSSSGPSPVLAITKTHAGNFTQGQSGATYTVTVSNAAGAGPTNGTVTVADTIPTGLTLVSMAGTGWTCATNSCTRSDVLAAGASYPAITVTVNVASNAPASVTNAVSASGGGSATANATDATTITTGTGPGNGVATVTPGPFDFGGVPLSVASSAQTFSLSNTGTGPLGSVAISTTNSDYAISSNTCPTTLAAGAPACTFAVIFTPSFQAPDPGAILVTDDSSAGPTTVPLSGSGEQSASVYVLPFEIFWDGQTPGTASTSQSATVFNTTDSGVSITGVTFAGNAASDFSVASNNCGDGADPSCAISVVFTPSTTVLGPRTADLTIATNQTETPLVSHLTGNGAIRHLPGFAANVLAPNDDGSTNQITLPFTINFFGESFSSLYVNNNGNVTFGSPLGEFTPTGLNGNNGGNPIIAPFWADVDTRGIGSAVVTYGVDTVNGHPAFGVNYENVGYYDTETDKLNSFQVILIDRSDTGIAGAFDIEFDYDKVQWEAGDLSGGSDGLCTVASDCAAVGYSNGSGTTGTNFQLNGSFAIGALLDDGPTATSLIHNSLNNTMLGRYVFQVRNGLVQGSLTVTEAGTGAGTVTSAPAGISCPTTCSANFASGAEVTLTASAAEGSTFAGWSGGGCAGTGTCVVTLNAATTVTATFNAGTGVALTVVEAGTGSGTVTSAPAGIGCPTTCSASFASGTQVTLTASASANSTFVGWSGGGCAGTGTCVVTLTAATTVTATFNSGSSPVTIGIGQGSTSTVTTTPGSSAVFGLVLTALPGTTGTVQLTCSSPVASITCNIVPSSITLTGKAINVAIVVETFCKGAVPNFVPMPGGFGTGLGLLLTTLCLCGAAWTYKKQPRWAVSIGLLIIFAVGMTACSNVAKSPSGSATPPGNYPLVVTATAPNGATSSVNLTLKVQ